MRERTQGQNVLAWFAAVAIAATSSTSQAQTGDAASDTAPRRIVSLNICTDEMTLRLADRARIASITWLSRDPAASNVASLAASVPVNYGLAEQVIPLNPDLVLAGRFTTRTAVALLRQAHFPVVEFGIADSVAGVRTQIRRMAALLKVQARGEQLIDDIDRRLASIGPVVGEPRPTALVFNPNGFTVGPGTLADEIMQRAGLDNAAAHMTLGNYSEVPLELIATSAINLLIVNSSRDGPPSLATEILHHPVLARLGANTRIVVLPSRQWGCPGPAVVEAIERLKAVADDIRQRKSGQ